MTNLDNLITRANNVLGALEGLLQGDGAETPIVDTSVSYDFPAISFSESNNEWILTQDTPDSSDGLYKGLFTLALTTGCAYLTVVSHNVVTPDDNVPARYLACGAGNLTDVATMSALNNKQITKLEIRSKQPFTVSIKLVRAWCYAFNFLETSGGFALTGNPATFGNYQPGVGWVAGTNGTWRNVQIKRTFPQVYIEHIEFEYVRSIAPTPAAYNAIGWVGTSSNGVSQQSGDAAGVFGAGGLGNVTEVNFYLNLDVHTGASGKITGCKIEGRGENPFSSNNCE